MHETHIAGLDLNLFPVVHALLEEQSVSRAAARVGLSQPATSRALARAREVLGDPLLVRQGQGYVLTARGQAMREPLAQALSLLGDVSRAPRPFDAQRAERQFVIGSADYAIFVLLPELLPRLERLAPRVDLRVRDHSALDALDELTVGNVDVLFAPRGHLEDSGVVRSLALFDEHFVTVVRRGHPLLRRGRMSLDDFVSASHAFIAPRGKPGGAVDDALARVGRARRVALSVPHFLLAPEAVVTSDLVLTVAERVARRLAQRMPLEIIEPPVEIPPFRLTMMWHESKHADPANVWLRELIRETSAAVAPPPHGAAPRTKRARRSSR